MPKRLTDEQRGPLGAWIVHQREARGWKQDEMVGRLAAVGYGVRADYYRQVEAGKKPGPDFLSALESLYGTRWVAPESPTPDPQPTAPTDLSALVAALDRQTAALDRLIETMATNQVTPPWWARTLMEAVTGTAAVEKWLEGQKE